MICRSWCVYALLVEGQVTRNLGIRLTRYRWIAFQDSDDFWLPKKLEILDAALRLQHYDKNWLVHGNDLKCVIESGITGTITPLHSEGDCYKRPLLQASPMLLRMLVSK